LGGAGAYSHVYPVPMQAQWAEASASYVRGPASVQEHVMPALSLQVMHGGPLQAFPNSVPAGHTGHVAPRHV
jgi:hypothetical protein